MQKVLDAERERGQIFEQAGFPDVKTLDQIDWDALQGISGRKIYELASCQFVEAAEDVVIAGPIGHM